MPLPAFVPFVASAVAGIPFRAALGNLVGILGRVAAVTFRSRLAWGLAAVWGINAMSASQLEAIPIIGMVKAALVSLRNWADGKIMGAFPEEMQPAIAFINYHVPISESLFVAAALANLYILIHLLILAIWAYKQVKALGTYNVG